MGEADIAKLIEEMSNSFSAELKQGFDRIDRRLQNLEDRMDSFDRRLKHADSNVTVALELLVRQSRWHQETDATVEHNTNRLGMLESDVREIKQRLGL
jgi:hypothetical protein